MSSDFAWLTEHSQEIDEKYRGKWIAVLDGEVVGIGDTATEAASQAEKGHESADHVLEFVDSQPERI